MVATKSLVASAFFALLVTASALADTPRVRLDKADQAWARRATLEASDFAIGWRGGATESKRPVGPSCPGFDPKASDLVVTGHANSGYENTKAGIQVSLDTQVLSTEQAVRIDFARTIRPPLADCLEYQFRKGASNFTSVTVERLDFPKVGSVSAAYRATIVVRTSGRVSRVSSDFVFFGRGRLEYSLNVVAPARYNPQLLPFEADLARILVRRAASRSQ